VTAFFCRARERVRIAGVSRLDLVLGRARETEPRIAAAHAERTA
jgi:hypothetical protein